MTDIQTLKDMAAGLRQKQKNLRAGEAVFLKVSGLNEEIEKASQENQEYKAELVVSKKRRDEAKARKADAVSKTTAKIAGKMNQVLPFGEAVFSYDEDEDGKRLMRIGWKTDGKTTPYNGLSGAQKQIFDSALMLVLDADIIVVEAAELDPTNLGKTLKELAGIDKQVLISTCHSLDGVVIPKNFEVMEV